LGKVKWGLLMEKKQFKSIEEMIEHNSTDEEFKKDALKAVSGRRLAQMLLLVRCKNKMTQKDLAEKLGCSQGRISKIESSPDARISIKDLLDYAAIFDLQLEIGYCSKNSRIVDEIKHHAIQMYTRLQKLSELAQTDPSIAEGVRSFHLEAFFNLMNLVTKSYDRLPKGKTTKDTDKNEVQTFMPTETMVDLLEQQ